MPIPLPPGAEVVSVGKLAPPPGAELSTVDAPSYWDVLSEVPQQVGLSFIESAGGGLRMLGDFIRNDSLGNLGGDIARTARGAAADLAPAGMTDAQEIISSGLQSAGQMLPAVVLGPASIAPVGIGLAAGQQTTSRYSELRDAGFSGGMAGLHASIDGLAEGLGEMISLPVLAAASRPFLNKLWNFMARDMAGEQLTTAMQTLNAALSDRPDMTWGEYLEAAKMTALVTPIAAGAQIGAYGAAQAARGALAQPGIAEPPVDLTSPPPVDPAPAEPPPVPPAPTAEPPVEPVVPEPAPVPPAPTATPPAAPAPVDVPTPSGVEPTVAVPPQPVAVAPEPTPAPVNAEVSADEIPVDVMRAMGQFDPRIYNALTDAYNQFTITHDGNGIYTYSGTKTSLTGTANEVIDEVLNQHDTYVDIRSEPQFADKLYDHYILGKVIAAPHSLAALSPTVLNRFGGLLADIAAAADIRNNNLAGTLVDAGLGTVSKNIADIPEQFYNERGRHLVSGADAAYRLADVGKKGAKEVPLYSPADHQALTPGTYVAKSVAAPEFRKAAHYLEQLRRRFMPDKALIFTKVPGHKAQYGSFSITSKALVVRLSEFQGGQNLLTLTHEFTHAIVSQHYASAAPEVKAKLLLSYLNYVKELKADDSITKFLLEHQNSTRGGSPHHTARKLDKPSLEYLLGPSEYWAEQGAQYLLGKTTFTGALKQWYDKLITSLKAIYGQYQTQFQPDTTFVEWLEGLAGPDKISSASTNTRAKKPKTAPQIVASPAPAAISPTADTATLIRRKKRMVDALEKAGASEEQIDAILGPNGLLHEFKWDEAMLLLDSLGVPPNEYMARRNLKSIDDTTMFREQLHSLNRSLVDSDLRESMAEATASVKSFTWGLQKTITAVQLRKRFGSQVPGVKAFVDTLERMFAYRSRWKEIADDRLKDMKTMPQKERNAVFGILLEEDKTEKFASKVSARQLPDGSVERTFTLDPAIARKYNLTEAGIQLYSDLRADFDKALLEIEFNAVRELERLYGTTEGGRKKILELKEDFNTMRSKPYVPHTRFGTHTVTVRNEKGKVIEFYQLESRREAKSQEATSRKEAKAGWVVSRGRLSEETRAFIGLPPKLISAMKAQLNLDETQIDTFEELIKDMSSGASFVRRFKKRKNTSGWEDEAELFPRAYADYYSRFANHASRVRFNPILNEAVSDVRKQGRDFSAAGINTEEIDSLANWLRRLQDYVNNPGEEFANARAAATIWHLGFSPKSALVNATGVPMVTVPYLSKRFGWTRSAATVAQAYKDIARMYTRIGALTEEERSMIEDLRERGLIDASFASELAGIREGGRLADMTALSKGAAAFFGVKQYAMWMFHKVEVVNRMVTALAAYRLYRNTAHKLLPGEFDAIAAKNAATAIQDTQNENGQWNRAEFMRNRKGILTMFMSYQQNLIYQMFGGDESWMRLLAVQMLIAGLMGLPFAKDADELIKWFSRRVFGSDFNAEKAIRAWLKDTVVDADWLLRGASHNVFKLDLQGSISQGRVIPGVEALASEGDFSSRIANAAGDVGGAGFSIIMDVMRAASSEDPRVLNRVQSALPAFFKSVSEGAKALTNGRIDDFTGAKVADVTKPEAIARMAGFQLSDVSQERGKRYAQRDTANYWINRRQHVLNLYGLSLTTDDPSWRTKANEALREFNREAPDRSLRITGDQIRQSMTGKLTSKVRKEQGLGPSPAQSGTYSRVGELYE